VRSLDAACLLLCIKRARARVCVCARVCGCVSARARAYVHLHVRTSLQINKQMNYKFTSNEPKLFFRKTISARFEVLIATLMTIQVYWDVCAVSTSTQLTGWLSSVWP
jgi:hypothetical protein